MIYGYIRVSTRRQAVRGNSLEEQQEILRGYGCQEIVQDVFTGSEMDRPGFEALAAKVRVGDTIIVTKLDRLGRTAIEGYTTVKQLVDKGVTVNEKLAPKEGYFGFLANIASKRIRDDRK